MFPIHTRTLMPVLLSKPVASLQGQGQGKDWASCWFEDFGLDSIVTQQFDKENRHKLKEYEQAKTCERRDWSFFYEGESFFGSKKNRRRSHSRKRQKRCTASEWKVDMDDAYSDEEECEEEDDDDDDDSGARCTGDEKLEQIFYLLDTILHARGWTREDSQAKLHKSYVIASLPQIYGKEWEVHSQRVLKKFGVTDLKSMVLALFPRRFGKTISISIFVSVMLVVMSGITISTFSTGRRASGNLMDECLKLISEHPHLLERVLIQNQEKLRIAEKASMDGKKTCSVNASTFNSYPSNPKGQFTVYYITYRLFQIREGEGEEEEEGQQIGQFSIFLCTNTVMDIVDRRHAIGSNHLV